MNIVLKTSLKNIFGKPFRTMLVVFSIFLCSICAMVCFDFVTSAKKYIGGSTLGFSKADCLLMASDYPVKGLPEGFPECEKLELNTNSEKLYKDIEGEYCYVTFDKLGIFGVNVDDAVNMEFIDPVTLGLNETVVTAKFAESYGYEVGDKLIVHDRLGNIVELDIVGITYNESNYFVGDKTAIVNEETSRIISCGRNDIGLVLIDVLDDEVAADAIRMLEDYYPNATLMNFVFNETMEKSLNQVLLYFYLVFAITFLLVIFVTASICNRIVSERMPFIGTLRSLGMSNARTGRILLLENTLYALLGSIPGILLYSILRVPVLDFFFSVKRVGSSFKSSAPPISVLAVICVILGAILIECLIPMKAVLKALKTSIRDIIFDNRDTAYKFSKSGLIIGIVFAAAAIVTAFFSKNFVAAIICMACSVTSLAFVFPWIFKWVTSLIRKTADKKENAKWSLASVEAVSRKSTVGSGVLCVTAAAMCVIVFSFVQSSFAIFDAKMEFTSDVVVDCAAKMKSFSFIDKLDGVTESEAVYISSQGIQLNDEIEEIYTNATFYALPEGGFKYYISVENLPDKIEDGTILVNDKYASKKGLNVGDTIKICYGPTSLIPIVREYKIVSLFESDSFSETDSFFISEHDYKEVFKDSPCYILIKCEDPDYVANMIRTYAVGTYSNVRTLNEVRQEQIKSNAKVRALTVGIILIAVGMTFIGMVSNQLIGFEGRKKECAVLLSTAMGRDSLSGILFREMLITALTASTMGTVIGVLMLFVLNASTSTAEFMKMDVEVNPVLTILFCIFLVIAFTGTVLFPIAQLKKMKIAEQIKYE